MSNKYRVQLNWKLTLFYLLMMPLLVSLGFWQLERADYKQQIQDQYQARAAATPVSINQLDTLDDVAFRRISLQGRFDNEHAFLLDNQTSQGRVGYQVVSPFLLTPAARLADGQAYDLVWINRGWIALGQSRDQLPVIDKVAGEQQGLLGSIMQNTDNFLLAETPLSGHWPEVIQRLDEVQMTQRLFPQAEMRIFPYVIRLLEGQPGSFHMTWQPLSTGPEKSLGYAVQWFLMAAVLTGLYLLVSIRRH